MADRIYLPGGILSMASAAADRLIASGSGDASLVYLWLLKKSGSWDPAAAARALKWEPHRVREALKELVDLGLADPGLTQAPAPAPMAVPPPEYSAADITSELQNADSAFPALVQEVQRQLGKILSTADLRCLYTVYDFAGLPPEVILLVVSWCIEEHERKYGQGRRPHLPAIQKEALRWKEQGIDTVEAADAHLKRLEQLRDRARQILALMDIRERPPVTREKEYIAAWIDMGFPDEVIRAAYERTVLKKQSLSWPYMNSILKSWHQKGFHTLEQIREKDSAPAVRSPGPAVPPAGEADRRAREDMERLRAFMNQQRKEEE